MRVVNVSRLPNGSVMTDPFGNRLTFTTRISA